MAILSDADNPAIRAAIDAQLAPRDLPDAIIAAPTYRPAAEAMIARRLPDRPLTEAEAAAAKRAAINLCAALLVPVAPLYQSETIENWSGTRAKIDPAALEARLRQLAEEDLGTIADERPVGRRRSSALFAIARSRR